MQAAHECFKLVDGEKFDPRVRDDLVETFAYLFKLFLASQIGMIVALESCELLFIGIRDSEIGATLFKLNLIISDLVGRREVKLHGVPKLLQIVIQDVA